MSKLEKIENAKVKITSEIDAAKWQEAQKNAFHKLARKVEIKGFRKGQAPANMVKKYISDQEVYLEAAESVADEAFQDAIKEHEIDLIDRPSLDIEKLDKDTCVLNFICPVKPDVELKEYKGLGYAPKKVTVKASEIEDELKKLQQQKAELVLKEEGTVENGDTTVIDFEGFKDGVPFEGGKGENFDLEIGSGQFIPGFEEQLIGMKAEETKEIEVKFPENYGAKNLAGAPATFKVTVHEIKQKVLPEITEEIIADLKIDGVKTLEDLKKHIKDFLKKNKETQEENNATNELLDKLVNCANIDIPEIMIKNEAMDMINDYANQLASQGIPMDQYLKMTGSTQDKMLEMMKPDAEKKVRISLILDEIVKKENLSVEDKDIDAEYERLATYYSMPKEDVQKYISESQVKADLLSKKALDFVKNN